MIGKKLKKIARLFSLPLVLTFCILCAVYAAWGVFPFGPKPIAWGDMTQQVLPFMVQFKDIAAGRDGILFNLGNAAGMNFWGVVLFFIASPFTLLGTLVPREYFYEFATVLVALKILLAACSATAFFGGRCAPFCCVVWQAGLLGVMYAFCGYTLLYYQNIVWLDQLIWFPLLMMALRTLFERGRVVPFALALAVSIYLQFQIGYMVVLATVIAGALFVLLCPGGKAARGATALRLGAAAALAGLLSAVAWLPALLQYLSSGRSGSVVEGLASARYFTHFETTFTTLLCTGTIAVAVVFLCFKKRFMNAGVLYHFLCFALFSIPLVIEPINMMWHAGSYQAFPTRYGFIPVFYGLTLVCAGFERLNKQLTHKKTPLFGYGLASMCALVCFAVLGYILLYQQEDASAYARTLWGTPASLQYAILACVAVIIAVGILFYLASSKLLSPRVFALFLCVVVGAECFYNAGLYIGGASKGGYATSYGYAEMMDLAARLPREDGRVKQSRKYTDANNLGAMGYDSISHYSSLTKASYMDAVKALGYSGYWMEISGPGGTLLTDSFLNINATVCQNNEVDPAYIMQDILYKNAFYALVKTPVPPTQGLVLRAVPGDIATLPTGSRFDVQDWIYQNIYGGKGALCRRYTPAQLHGIRINQLPQSGEYMIDDTGEEANAVLVYQLEIQERETLYFDAFYEASTAIVQPAYGGFLVQVNGVWLENNYPSSSSNGLLNLGTFENETVEIQIALLHDEVLRSFGVAGVRHRDVLQAVENVRDVTVENAPQNIQVRTQAHAGELLVLPLAYDEGMAARINGRKVAVARALGGFTALALQEGGNEIEIRFLPRGFLPGTALTGTGFVLLCGWGLVSLLKRRRVKGAHATGRAFVRVAQKASFGLLLLAFGGAMIAVYLAPLIVWILGHRGL